MVKINLDRIENQEEKEKRAILRQRQPFGNHDLYEMKFGPFPFKIAKSKDFPFDSVFGFISEEDIRQQFFYPEVNSGYVVFDVGATCGSYTIPPLIIGASVLAFEPDPRWAICLNQNIFLNGLKENFRLANCALWSGNGMMTVEELEEVPCTSLDWLIESNNLQNPDYIKIDTEGAELEIIKGSLKTIKEKKPKILIEHHLKHLPNGEQEISDILDDFGYKAKRGPRRDMTSWSFYVC